MRALGVVVWPMVEVEADDALASAAWTAASDRGVEQVVICTPDKGTWPNACGGQGGPARSAQGSDHR